MCKLEIKPNGNEKKEIFYRRPIRKFSIFRSPLDFIIRKRVDYISISKHIFKFNLTDKNLK